MSAVLVLHWNTKVHPVPGPLTRKNMTAHILLMQTLHDDDERRLLRVVQTSSRQFLPPCQSRLAIGVAFRLFSIVRILHDQNVPPDPKQRATNRCSKP